MKAEPGVHWQGLWRVLATLLSHYRRHPGQTAFMAIGLVAGVALWSAVEIINDHARTSYAGADRLLGAQVRYWIRAVDGRGVEVGDYIALRRSGFTTVYPMLEAVARDGKGRTVRLIATDLLALPLNRGRSGDESVNPILENDWLSLVQPPYQTWYPPTLAERLGLAEGESLALADGTRLPPASIRSRGEQGQRVFLDVGAALAVLGESRLSYLAVGDLDEVARERLEAELPKRLRLVSNRQVLDLGELTASLHTNLSAMGLLSFIVGLFIVSSAVRLSLQARQGTMTTLRELGVSGETLVAAIGLESMVWALAGTALGMVAGYALAHLLLPAVSISLQSLFGAPIDTQIGVQAGRAVQALALTLGGVLLALATPLWRRSSEPIRLSRAGRGGPLQTRARMLPYSLLTGALALAAIALLPMIDSVRGGFLVLGLALLVGTLLLVPLLIASLHALLYLLPGRYWQVRWAISDAWSQLPGLQIALIALLLTFTANIGVTTMVDSFREAFSAWLDERLNATLFVQSENLRAEELRGHDWLLASDLRRGLDLRFGGRPASVRGINLTSPDADRLQLVLAEPGALDRWRAASESPSPILASEQVHYLADVPLGAIVQLDTPSGPAPFRVVGFFHDYGNAAYQFYLPRTTLTAIWPRAPEQGLALWVRDGGEEAAIEALQAAGAKPGEWRWQREVRQLSFQVFDRTFAITASLNALTLLVAGTALLSALMALHHQRLPEYSHWRALGLSQLGWLALVAVPLLLLMLITGLLALPLGRLLSWLLIDQLNVIAFGWTMPVLWSWSPALRLALIAAGMLALSLALAAWRVRRTLPAGLRQFTGVGQ